MFIGRRIDGSIYGMWSTRQPDDADHLGQEELPDDHPDVLAFGKPTPRQVVLAQLAAIDQAASAVRWIREFALGSNAGFTQIRDNVLPSLPTAGPGMVTLEQIEARAIALRAQLATLK